jgi:5'-nucleotidase
VRILVTNDDGVSAPGLLVLAQALAAAGHDLVVAAPLSDNSGAGAAIGPVHLSGGVTFQRMELDQLPGVAAYGLDGPPALAVLMSRLEAFGPAPDAVVSGINPGNNTGRAVLHSGTVGAALTAANMGLSGVAVSVGFDGETPCYDTAAPLAVAAAAWLRRAPTGTVLNVNVPGVSLEGLADVTEATLAPFGTVRTVIVGADDGRFELEMQPVEVELPADSDTALIAAGHATVTALVRPHAVPDNGAAEFIATHLRNA